MGETTRNDRADVGKCPECGKPTQIRGRRCEICSAKHKEDAKERYREQVIEARICHKCRKEPAADGLKSCIDCAFGEDGIVDWFMIRDGGGEEEDPQWQPWWRQKGQKGWRFRESVRKFAAEEKTKLQETQREDLPHLPHVVQGNPARKS